MNKRVKIIPVPIESKALRQYEGEYLLYETGLVKLLKVYPGSRIDFAFYDTPNEVIFSNFPHQFFILAGWDYLSEDQDFYPIANSQRKYAINYLLKNGSKYITFTPEKFSVSPVKMFLNEKEELTFRWPK